MPSAFAATRDGIDVMLRDRGLRRTTPDQTAESLLRGAHASAVLEGSASSEEEVRGDSGDQIAQAAVRVSTELLSLVPVLGRSPAQVFARLHSLTGGASAGRPVSPEASKRLQSLSQTLLRDLGAGPAGRCAGARRPGDRGAVRGPQRNRRSGGGTTRAGGPGSRPGLARRTGGGAPGAAGGVRVEPAGLSRRRHAMACTRGCSMRRRHRRRAPRRARFGPEHVADAGHTDERHRDAPGILGSLDAARHTDLATKRAFSNCGPRRIRV